MRELPVLQQEPETLLALWLPKPHPLLLVNPESKEPHKKELIELLLTSSNSPVVRPQEPEVPQLLALLPDLLP